MDKKIKVLILEDLPSDAELAERELKKVLTNYTVRFTDTEKAFVEALETFKPDLIISDYQLPSFTGLEALRIVRDKSPFTPFIILTGSMNEDTAVECIKAGADDYVIKEHIKRLGPAALKALEKKQTEKERYDDKILLQESEKRFRQIFQFSPDAILIHDFEMNILDANNKAVELFGYSRDELLKKKVTDLHTRDELPHSKQVLSAMKKSDMLAVETKFKRKDGSVFLAEATPCRYTLGSKPIIHVTIHDITKRKKSEEALKQSEERFRSLYENATLGLYRTTPDGEIILANPALIKMLGYSSFDELAGQNLEEDIYQLSYPRKHFIETIEKEGEIRELESVWKRRDGSEIFVRESARAVRDSSGKTLYYDGTVEDITERKQAEMALRESEERFSAFMETLPITSFIKDSEHKYFYVNREMKRVFHSDNWVGKTTFDIFPSAVARALVDTDNKAMSKGYSVDIHTVPDKTGIERIWETHTFRIDRKDREPLLGGFSLDITEQRHNEETILEQSKFHRLRADLWQVANAADQSESDLIRKMLDRIGAELDVSRATFLRLSPDKKEYIAEHQWNTKDAGPSPSQSISYAMAKHLFGKKFVELPKDLVPGIKQYVNQKFKKNGIHSYLVVPYGDRNNPSGLFTFSECRHPRRWTQMEIDSLLEIVNIISLKSEDIKNLRAVRESEARLKEAQALGRIGSWEYDIETGETIWSEQTYKLYERDPEIGPPTSEEEFVYYSPEQAEQLKESTLRAIKEKQSFSIDLEPRLPSGKTVFYTVIIKPVKDSAGNVVRLRGTVQDITEHRQSEIALRESEERFRAIVENSYDGIFIVGDDFCFEYVNNTFCNILRYPQQEILGHDFRKFLDEESKKLVADRYLRRRKGEKVPPHYEFKIVRKNGEVRWVDIKSTVVKYQQGDIKTIAQIRDITERKQAEAELIRLKTAIEQSAEAIVITDIDGNIQYVNPAFEQITGYSRDEVIGQNPRILKSGRQEEPFYKDLWDTITSGSVWRGRIINRRKDGSLYKRDISKEQMLEEQLLQSQKMEAVGTLAGGVAHDFNNLLTIIQGHAQLMMLKISESDPNYRELRQIVNATTRAASLTRQLLLFSRKEMMEFKPINLNETIGNLLKMLKRLIGEDIRIVTSFDDDLWQVNADGLSPLSTMISGR